MISNLYIDKIVNLYKLSDKEKGELLKQTEKIDATFAEYDWEDVEAAINEFYRKKESAGVPRPAQVSAFINKKAKKSVKQEFDEYVKPTTNIKIIQDCFYDVCRLKYIFGLAYSDYFAKVEHLPFGNKMRCVKKTLPTGEIQYSLVNLYWVWLDRVAEAKERFPDIFAKFKYADENEQFALAYKMGVLKLDLNYMKNVDTTTTKC